MNIEDLKVEIAAHLQDPQMLQITSTQLLTFINSAARDLRNSGILIHLIDTETIRLQANEYEYDIPPEFAFVQDLRIGNEDFDVSDATDSGATLAAAVSDTTTPTISISDGSVVSVNDIIILDTEALRITAADLTATPDSLTVTRGEFDTTAATHSSGTAVEYASRSVEFNEPIPHVLWRIALESDAPMFKFDSRAYSLDAGRLLQIKGQKRPSLYTLDAETVDIGLETFLRERGLSYAARMAAGGGSAFASHRSRVADTAFGISEQFLTRQPQRFRVLPRSFYVPGR